MLGASFRGSSWRPWHVLAKIISGHPLDDSEMALVLECTRRRVLPQNPPRLLYLLVGRRGGKSRFLSALAVWVAALAANWRNLMAPGEPAVVMLVACDKKQPRFCDAMLMACSRRHSWLLKSCAAQRSGLNCARVRCWKSQQTTTG